MPCYFVRLGAMAEIHTLETPLSLQRGWRVLVRSRRGVELAEVAATRVSRVPMGESSLRFLRVTTPEDELLLERLERHKCRAVEACREALTRLGSTTVLLDVDQIFDGGTLLMHFLGEVDPIAQTATREIVERYEAVIRSRDFAKLLTDGCGPDCGSGQLSGCGSGCAGCAIAGRCGTN